MSTGLHLSVDEFDQMVARGAFDHLNRKIELIRGELREMNPAGPLHDGLIMYLNNWSVMAAAGKSILVSSQTGLNLAELENMHIHKTGALIRASVLLGALSQTEISNEIREGLDHYGKCIGLAFQIQDDILDVISDTQTLGKTQGADIALNKPTYPSLLGLDGARQHAKQLYEDALDSLAPIGVKADTLRWLAGYIVERAF